jgi:hypothetical protein
MARTSLPIIAVALAGCSAQQPPATVAPTAGTQVSCIDLTKVTARYAQPPSSIMFEVPGEIDYRNDLASSCPGVERANGSELIETESQGKQLCRDDPVRVYDPVEARATGSRSFPMCRLGNFTVVVGH